MQKQWLLLAATALLVLAAVPVLAQMYGDESPEVAPMEPVRSDEGIDPDECNRVHNLAACEGQPPPVGPDEPMGPDEPVSPDEPTGPDQPVSSDEPGVPDAGTGRTPGASPVPVPPGMARAPAPIEHVEIQAMESFPPQYAAQVVYGLPNGCARPGGYDVQRQDDLIRINVYILRPAAPGVICTQIYGTATHRIPLGSDFTPGQTYTLLVNGTPHSFTAQ